MAIHPFEPWLAVACTNSRDECGAVLVFDAQAGTLLSSTTFDTYIGWADSRDLLRWHPDGARLATNISTNGIAVLDRGRLVGEAHPDETRDYGVSYVWVGDQIFADTGALFTVEEGDSRFDFDELEVPGLRDMQWNAATGAVVGRSGGGLVGFDPLRNKLLYEVQFDPPISIHDRWSADGRWCAIAFSNPYPGSDCIKIYDGDDGALRWTVQPSSPRIEGVQWAADGTLLVRAYTYTPHKPVTNRVVDVVRQGRITATVALADRQVQRSTGVPEAAGIAASPSGDGFALLLDRQDVRIFDTRSGGALLTFRAPAPAIPAGLPDFYRGDGQAPEPGGLLWIAPQRLVRLGGHFVAFWSLDGTKIAEFVVPDVVSR